MSALSNQANVVLQAYGFVRRLVDRWLDTGQLRPDQYREIVGRLNRRRAEVERTVQGNTPLPDDLELPVMEPLQGDPGVGRALWFHQLACDEVRRWATICRLSAEQVDTLLTDLRGRMASLRVDAARAISRVPIAAIPDVVPLMEEEAATPPAPRRNLLEILLDPRSIQWLLGSGGGLMVVGLIILLWVNHFFTPPVVAVSLGIGNALLLVGGGAVLRKSRYRTAGKALTLLACLVMPLNLWYYHANGLVTIEGHLWMAGLVICGLYTASALMLRDETFVYILAAGITMTGLLVLADLHRFGEIAYPATLLVVLGLLGIHVERSFPEQEGPFGRRRFGRAFFRSGHVLLAAGLVLVLGAEVTGDWLYKPFFKLFYDVLALQPSPLVSSLRLLALGLVVAGTYGYLYSGLIVQRASAFIYVAAATSIWAGALVIEELGLRLGVDAVIALLAGLAMAAHLVRGRIGATNSAQGAVATLGLGFGLMPVLLGALVFLNGYVRGLPDALAGAGSFTWGYVSAMVLTAVACRVGAILAARQSKWEPAVYLYAYGVSTLIGAVGLLSVLGLQSWKAQGPLLMLVPIVYQVMAVQYRKDGDHLLVPVSHTLAVVLFVLSLPALCQGFALVEGATLNLAVTAFLTELAIFCGIDAAFRKQVGAVHAATLFTSGALWQLLAFATVSAEVYPLMFGLIGLVALIASRVTFGSETGSKAVRIAAFHSAHTLLTMALVAAILLGLSRLAADQVRWQTVAMSVVLGAMSLAAASLAREPAWSRTYYVGAIAQGLVAGLMVVVVASLTPAQKVEIFSVTVGVVLLTVGHIGWYREQDRPDDAVTLCLLLGSLAAGVPLAIATLIDRSYGYVGAYLLNEFGFLTVAVALLVSGFLFRLRATTLVGAALTALYFLTLLIFIPWSRLNTVAVVITVGGSVLFAAGLGLSIYRERLLTLPERIKRREGMFRVLSWR